MAGWLGTLAEACEKTGWQIHAYVMMGNHYHLKESRDGKLNGLKQRLLKGLNDGGEKGKQACE